MEKITRKIFPKQKKKKNRIVKKSLFKSFREREETKRENAKNYFEK